MCLSADDIARWLSYPHQARDVLLAIYGRNLESLERGSDGWTTPVSQTELLSDLGISRSEHKRVFAVVEQECDVDETGQGCSQHRRRYRVKRIGERSEQASATGTDHTAIRVENQGKENGSSSDPIAAGRSSNGSTGDPNGDAGAVGTDHATIRTDGPFENGSTADPFAAGRNPNGSTDDPNARAGTTAGVAGTDRGAIRTSELPANGSSGDPITMGEFPHRSAADPKTGTAEENGSSGDPSAPVCMSDSRLSPGDQTLVLSPGDIHTDSPLPPCPSEVRWAARRTLALLEIAKVKPANPDAPTVQERRQAARKVLIANGMASPLALSAADGYELDYLESHLDHYLYMVKYDVKVQGRKPGVAWLVKHLQENYGTPAGYTAGWRWPDEVQAEERARHYGGGKYADIVQGLDDGEDDDFNPDHDPSRDETQPDFEIGPDPSLDELLPTGLTAEAVWEAAKGGLGLQLNRATFETWVQGIEIHAYEDGAFVLSVRNAYVKDFLESRLYRSIRGRLSDCAGQAVDVRFVVYDPVDTKALLGPSGEFEGEDVRAVAR